MNIKKILCGVILFYLVMIAKAGAHPPSQIELTYDAQKQTLTVKIDHVSSDVPTHRIRKIEIIKNEEPPIVHYYPSQSPQGITQEVPLKCIEGDLIKVKAFCTQSGPQEETLKVALPKRKKATEASGDSLKK